MRRRVSIFYSTTFAKKKSTQTKHVFKILEIITSLRNTHTLHQCVEGSTLNERQVFFICQSGIINNNNNKYVCHPGTGDDDDALSRKEGNLHI